MKVVLFCGGLGLRMRDSLESHVIEQRRTSDVPKPLVTVGGKPLLQHLMAWYAGHGHRHFVLCLGAGGDAIRSWVRGSGEVEVHPSASPTVESLTLHGGPLDGWRIDLAETGADSPIGQRLAQVAPLVEDEPVFLANYADGLSDVPLDDMIARAADLDADALFVSVPPPTSVHSVTFDPASGAVCTILPLADAGTWINGGFFVLRPTVFAQIRAGEDLIDEPFARLIAGGRLFTYPYRGFWRSCDNAKDRKALQDLWDSGERPWTHPTALPASAATSA